MKKLLLINPSFNIAKAKYDTSISVGLLCLASYLDKKGVPIKIIDCARQDNWRNILEKELPDAGYIGFSVMTTQIPSALQISGIIRRERPELKLIWGGCHVNFFPGESLEHSLIDFVILNEGEETLWELLQELEKKSEKQNFSLIKGLAYKEGGQIYINPKRELLAMSEIPLPNWKLMPQEVLEKLELVPTHTSRGCPHRCAFCINAITQNRWRKREPQEVLEDLKIIKAQPWAKNKKVRFWDENFFVDIARVKKIVDGMITQGLDLSWETTIRADYFSRPEVNDDLLAKLKRSGCYLLSFGAESGSTRILKKIDKDITRAQIVESARRCLRHEIIPQYSFMVGLPGEEREDIDQTISLIDELLRLDERIQILGPQAFRPYPGSTLYEECLKSGWRAPRGLESWSRAIVDETSFLTPYQFPWVGDPDLAASLEAYVRFGAHRVKNAMSSTIRASRSIKLAFILICRLRWKLKFFRWPIEYKIAKQYVAR